MKRILTSLVLLTAVLFLHAANTTQSRTTTIQLAMTVPANTDYVLSAATPFSRNGSLNITDTEHSVVIFKSIKPSVVKSTWLRYIMIDGQTAVDGQNCQVKLYNAGAIIMPYASNIKPLTCYSGQDLTGTVCNDYGTGNTNGYMNTLTDGQLLNNIRSFRLKRGYMVTFAVGTAGWGYSRCFIADKEDLELSTLPAVLSGKISSYRIFKWYDAQKKGVSGDSGSDVTGATNASWSFTWGTGSSQAPDVEFVPHKIKKSWPGNDEIGRASFSPHAKTDNEPANSADEEPCSASDVLAYWEDLMRTGHRLCSPSTYDGGNNASWFSEFFSAIDARGWRCDIYDRHCYWTSVSQLQSDYNTYHRPIWVSELMWGASWNKNGIFGAVSDPASNSSANQTALYNGAKPIVDALNSYPYVERYAWWNQENVASKIYYNGSLTTFGQYYASMESGLAYDRNYEYVPKVVIGTPGNLSGNAPSDDRIVLKWTDPNGDMVDAIEVQYKRSSDASWKTLKTVTPKDKSGSDDISYMTAAELSGAKNYMYRIVDSYEGNEYVSNSLSFNVAAEWITSLPANVEDYYFVIHSKEASTDLVWSVNGPDVVYQSAASVGSDMKQLWTIEQNSYGGYTMRNLSTPSYVVCSPNSWNFNTNNDSYVNAADKATYLPEYNVSGDYWTLRNVAHKTYIGLWDADKNFGTGERLAGNRANKTSGNDSADKLRIYAVPRSELNDVIGNDAQMGQWTTGQGYYFYNVESGQFLCAGNDWGTRSSLSPDGTMWNVTAGQYTNSYHLGRKGTTNYLGLTSNTEAWVDRGASDHSSFELSTSSNGTTLISVASADPNYGSRLGMTYLGWNGTVGNTIAFPCLSNNATNGIHWILMDGLSYLKYNAIIRSALSVRQEMWPLVQNALSAGTFAEQVALYMNPASTAEQLTAAKKTMESGGSQDDATWKSGTTYHIYNIEAGMYLGAGAQYGTQATLQKESTGWNISKGSADGLYRLNRKGANNYLFAANTMRLYVDGASTTSCDFVINPCSGDSPYGRGSYTISINPSDPNYGTAAIGETTIGWNNEYDLATLLSCVSAEDEFRPGTHWLIMDDFEYALHYDAISAAREGRQTLAPLLRSALNNGLDVSAELELNANPEATLSELLEAANGLKQRLLADDNITDYTFLLTNPLCEGTTHTGWTLDGEWGSNLTEYFNDEAFFNGRFFEAWVASNESLANRSLSLHINGIPDGWYQLSLNVIATHQSNNNELIQGALLFIGDSNKQCSTQNGSPRLVTTNKVYVQGGEVQLGVRLEQTNANWVAFDGFSLKRIQMPGDIDDDGELTLADLTQLIQCLSTGSTTNVRCDVDGNGVCNKADIKALADKLLQIVQ